MNHEVFDDTVEDDAVVIEALQAEVEQLRDALHEIAGTSYSREVAADIAKQALEKGDE